METIYGFSFIKDLKRGNVHLVENTACTFLQPSITSRGTLFIKAQIPIHFMIYLPCIFSLLKHNIEPIVIFDGSYEEDKKKTKWKRTREQLHAAIRQVPTMDGRDAILPIFSKGDLLSIVPILVIGILITYNAESTISIISIYRHIY